jgi:prepilin-type N-terminal cleavage/methylation domain-containing protein
LLFDISTLFAVAMMKKQSGFTMIEVIVVMALIAIAAAMAIPTFTVWMPNYRLRAATNDLYANLQLAKSGAVRDHGEWAVQFDTVNNSYGLVSKWGEVDQAIVKTVVLSDYGSGVAFGHGNATDDVPDGANPIGDDVTYGADVAVFNMRGTCSAGYVYLENSRNNAFAVGSLSSGAVRMRRWSGSTWE